MKFTIVAYPSKFSEIGFNYLLVRISDGEIVGMIEECAVDDMKQVLGMSTNVSLSGAPAKAKGQMCIPFRE